MGNRLSDKEIQNLIYIHKILNNKRDADKVKCLVLWGKGWEWEKIQEALLVNERYISDVKSKYKEKGQLKIVKTKKIILTT